MREAAPAPDWLAPGGGEAIASVVDATGHDDIECDVRASGEAEYITLPVVRLSRTYPPKRKRA